MAFCRNCGNPLTPESKFCINCGVKVEHASNVCVCPKCGLQNNPSAKFCRKCGNPMTSIQMHQQASGANSVPLAQQVRTQERRSNNLHRRQDRKRRGLFIGIPAAVLVLVVGVFVFQDWFKNKPLFGTKEDIVQLSPEKLSAETSLGVNVALTEYILDGEAELKVKNKEPIYEENGDYVITPYSVELGELHELNDYVKIEIPYDDSFMDSGESAEDCVCGVYLDPKTGEWEETLYTVDTKEKKVIIEADHFSDFGAMVIRNKGKRSAYISSYKYAVETSAQLKDEVKSLDVLNEYVMMQDTTPKALESGIEAVSKQFGMYTLDIPSNYLASAYYLELSDMTHSMGYALGTEMEMIAKNEPPVKWKKMVNAFAKMGKEPGASIFDTDLVSEMNDLYSKAGLVVSIAKVTYGIIASAAGSDNETVLNLYKDTASLAVSMSGDALLGASMFPVYIADQFITSTFEQSRDIRVAEIENSYQFYNRKFSGDSINGYRPGRGAKQWREVIIKMIEENPDADTGKLIKEEIERFANDYWNLDGPGMASLLSEMPKSVKRVPYSQNKERKKLTEEYIKSTYAELYPVMRSVQNYFAKKIQEEAKDRMKEIMKFNNRKIEFTISDMSDEGDQYEDCIIKFFPLAEHTDESEWTFQMDESGQISMKATFLAYELAGRPYGIAVWEPGADPMKDEPITIEPLKVVDYQCHITLKEREVEKKPKSSSGTQQMAICEDSIRSILLVEQTEKETLYTKEVSVSIQDNMDINIQIPDCQATRFVDKYYHEDEYYNFSLSGFQILAKAEEHADESSESYRCSANLDGIILHYKSDHYQKNKLSYSSSGEVRLTGEAEITCTKEGGKLNIYMVFPYDLEGENYFYSHSSSGQDSVDHRAISNSFSIECKSK